MAFESLLSELVPNQIPLDQIFLDPNNPRFTGSRWEYIGDEQIDDEGVQQNTRRMLIAQFGVEKLQLSIESNGFLPLDQVVVRRFGENKYVVLEGNRRICAAKMVGPIGTYGQEISANVLESLETINCLEYTGTEQDASWILQGLRHITGILDWSAYNKARLLVEQMESEDLSLTEVGQLFGLTPHGAGQWVRGYKAFLQAQESSDYVSEIDEKAYPFFQELFSRSSIRFREWLIWNETDQKFENELRFNEFLSWLYPRPTEVDDEPNEVKGDWNERLLVRRDDLRQLSDLIADDVASFEHFRRHGDLEEAYSIALVKKQELRVRESMDAAEVVFTSIESCIQALKGLPIQMIYDDVHKTRLIEVLAGLRDELRKVGEIVGNE